MKDIKKDCYVHRLPHNDPSTVWDRLVGAAIISISLFCLLFGAFVPLVILFLGVFVSVSTGATAAAVVLASMMVAGESTMWCRLYLKASGWFTKGVYVYYEKRAIKAVTQNKSMWCMHPHGTSIGFGFTINGAVRFRAQQEDQFLPPEVYSVLKPARMRLASGVQAPILFKLPLVRNLLLSFGCCAPASKKGMFSLFEREIDFGILPGGMEEVALFTKGRERVFLSKRAGFIKYALQFGYLLQPGYTFGECDLYHSMTAGASVRVWMLKNLGFVIPVFWGPLWYAPWLPRSDVALHTVIGSPLQLPRIENPSKEDVAKYHKLYVDALTEIFETYKEQFGYGDRTLEVM